MLNEAKREKVFVNEEGRVDIGLLIAELVTCFAEGRIRVIKPAPIAPQPAASVGESVKVPAAPDTATKSPATLESEMAEVKPEEPKAQEEKPKKSKEKK